MKLFFSFVFALLAFTACTKPEKEVYIFTSHREPALDGLHYLYSYDGYHWDNVSILDGEGSVNGIPVSKGQHFIVPAGFGDVIFKGSLSMICSQAV